MPQITLSGTDAASGTVTYSVSNAYISQLFYKAENTDAAKTMFVKISTLHPTSADAMAIAPGASELFRCGPSNGMTVTCWGSSATLVANVGVVGK